MCREPCDDEKSEPDRTQDDWSFWDTDDELRAKLDRANERIEELEKR